MPWFKVDDKFHDHRKVRRVSLDAIGLWTLAGSWSSDNLTDGFVPADIAPRWSKKAPKLAAELVASGLWVEREIDGEVGWAFHDWHERNPLRARVEADREAARERMQRVRGGSRSSEVRPNKERTELEDSAEQTAKFADGSATPSRPVPSVVPNGTTSMPRKRGERIPEPWVIDEAMWEWAAEKGFAAPFVNQQTERFVNYWRAKAGKDATKLDWRSTWKNWLLRAADDYRPTNGHSGPVDWDAAMARAQARDSQKGSA